MGLMTGSGPLGREPAGRFNFTPPAPGQALYIEPSPKRVRVVLGGHDDRGQPRGGDGPRVRAPARLLLPALRRPRRGAEPPPTGTLAAPRRVRRRTTRWWRGTRSIEHGAWYYPEPLPGAEGLRDLIAFYWDRMDAWYEEDEQVFVHPRDPYHRIDLRRSDRLVEVELDGIVLARSDRATALFESNLPTRWYLPREDVHVELEPSDTVSACPYKGEAGYFSVRMADSSIITDLIWFYADPLPEVASIAGLVCFFNERVDLTLDGERLERPESPWSHGVRSQNLPPAQTRG